MKTFIRGTVSALLLGVFAIVGAPHAGSAAPSSEWPYPYDAVLYELNENLSLRALRGGHRKATSQLLGFARVGSPLCPEALAGGRDFCTINATGSDNISLLTGLGRFGGFFTVVGQGDNPVDSPELVLARGRFSGHMDFSLALLNNPPVPLGTVRGEMALQGGPKQPFTGVFRLPFVVPMGGGFTPPLYLLDPRTFATQPVDATTEFAIGYPTVRFEITFD
jgi:hypothetical protein